MRRICRLSIYGLGVLLWLTGVPVLADENGYYDRINLSASAEQEVESDTVVAVLYAQEEGENLESLSDNVNRRIKQAISKSKAVDGIKVQTLAYTTQPLYQKQRLSGWLVRQSLRLESRDIDTLSELLGELQNSLAIQSVSYQISTQRRDEAEQVLINQAIAQFTRRAENVTRQLGREKYRLVSMNINTNDQPIQPMRNFAVMQESVKVAAPVIEPGTQRVQVSVNGTIELVVK